MHPLARWRIQIPQTPVHPIATDRSVRVVGAPACSLRICENLVICGLKLPSGSATHQAGSVHRLRRFTQSQIPANHSFRDRERATWSIRPTPSARDARTPPMTCQRSACMLSTKTLKHPVPDVTGDATGSTSLSRFDIAPFGGRASSGSLPSGKTLRTLHFAPSPPGSPSHGR